ncbi:MAG: hypothetical protein DMG06_19365 [Acidobacteria bacterium]|nr:MAG: hypothetical protein DMG06_19365 [Acidobacteriota bacterium]
MRADRVKLFSRRRATPDAHEHQIRASHRLGQARKAVFVGRVGLHPTNPKAMRLQLLSGKGWQSQFGLVLIFTDHHQD